MAIARRLGFGTPALMALNSKRKQFALLEAVISSGITHFDTAPYYGYGAVEPLIGEFLAAHGASVTITTKFGIEAPPPLLRGSFIMTAARRVGKLSPRLRRLMARGASNMVATGAFGVSQAQRSLRESLCKLRRDRIDYFLLHEPTVEDTERPGLLSFLERAVANGDIARFGTGASWERVSEIVACSPAFTSVLQFENTPPFDRVPKVQNSNRLVITFGCIGPAIALLRDRLAGESEVRGRLKKFGLDMNDDAALGGALLARALARNPNGMVLFATHNIDRLRRSVQAVERDEFTSPLFQSLEALLSVDQ